ncbi:uncharacterized protein HD556DRAFT_1484520 [Suillus plorans]|uniref:Uncharacterized protein n=1 Tax=Suillus plorans TaxID=116603 RepID=A0A9P7J5S5_9AGAM|nr:uncharacterized protein HD556DRAFT_1484520 [Suillus plorans]KAG1803905.1 hypothetical protein HD556DRAFT_1484520 [Suillus plorans]
MALTLTTLSHPAGDTWSPLSHSLHLLLFTFKSSSFSIIPDRHACGENPSRVYGMTRLDSGWNFHTAYDSARKLCDAQDNFCAKAESNSWDDLVGKAFPEDLQWESLVDSDHPVVNSCYLLNEAAQVHYYGLDPALALLSGTYTPATAMGMGHQIAMLKAVAKGPTTSPHTPDFDSEKVAAVAHEGVPPLEPRNVKGALHGLMFGGQNLLPAYCGGVTTAITAPSGTFLQGVSTAFSPGAVHANVENASVVDEVALHVGISMSSRIGVSTQIAALRNMLFREGRDKVLRRVRKGKATLIVDVESADIMAMLLRLKDEYEAHSGRELHLTFAGATEAHLLAHEISKPFPSTWEQRRILAGPPIMQESLVTVLLKAGVNVAIGVIDEYNARNTCFEAVWFLLTSNGFIDCTTALALATTNLEKALGVQREMPQDLVAYRDDDVFEFEAKVMGVLSETLGQTDLFV